MTQGFVVFANFPYELLRQEFCLKLFFITNTIIEYSLEHVLSICGQEMSNEKLKFKPDTRLWSQIVRKKRA